MDHLNELIILFSSAFLAATMIPAQSELILVGLLGLGHHSKILLFFVATVGNVLGSLMNWVIGIYLMKLKDKKWFPLKKLAKESALEKAKNLYQKWGVWSLLLAWVPIIGDPLTVVAGVFRTNVWLFLTLVTIGKATRYIVVLGLTHEISRLFF